LDIPRLILADERRKGEVPPVALVMSAMKQLRYPLRLFCAGVDEKLVLLLQRICGQSVTVLDPFLCGSQKNLKSLFQQSADSSALNIIIAPLGERSKEDMITVSPLTIEVGRALGCGIVPIVYGDTAATLTARTVENLVSQCDGVAGGPASVLAMLYMSVFNPREYQLLEIEQGRRTPLISLGYIPAYLQRQWASLFELSLPERGSRFILALRAAAAQLVGLVDQVDWASIAALATLDLRWSCPQDLNVRQLSHFTVAVYDHPAFSLAGDNAEQLFSYLGCDVVRTSSFVSLSTHEIDAMYIPHGIGFLAADVLIGDHKTQGQVKNLFLSRKPIMVNGGSALLLGQAFSLPGGRSYEGLGLFNYDGIFTLPDILEEGGPESLQIQSFTKGLFLDRGEKARGYRVPYARLLFKSSTERGLWGCVHPDSLQEIDQAGWELGYGVASHVVLELWSCAESVSNWLTLRKR
jgi:cobyrinic acid a,c-diamide synthase